MRRQRNKNSVLKRICRKIIAMVLIIGIPVVLFLFSFSVKKADVIGAERYTNKQIREMVLQTEADYNCVYLYLKYRFFTTPKIPFVEKIDVDMEDNHSVTIYVYEKMVTGCVEYMGQYLYFDKDGIVVESSPEKIEKVPVIFGLQFNEIVLNEKLNIQNEELFNLILNMTKSIDKYELDVDKIYFSSNYEITLECGEVNVLLGKKNNYDEALSDLGNILKEAEGTQLYELDMRDYKKSSGSVIGKSKKSTQ